MPNPLFFQVTTTAQIAWSGRTGSGVNTLLFMNTDLVNTVYLGNEQDTSPGNQSVPIPPNGSFGADPESTWYYVGAVAGSAPLVMVPNGQSFFRGLTQGQGNLALPFMQSPNYVAGVSGWTVKKDGSAEFNNLTVRGTFKGTNYVINAAGAFFYSGTPAFGNLIASTASTGGTDQFGNTYLPGNVSYIVGGSVVQMFNGQIVIGVPANIAGTGGASAAELFSFDSTGTLTIESGKQNTADTAIILNLESATTAPGGMPTAIVQGVLGLTELAASPGVTPVITQLFANNSGELIVRDSGDGVTYGTERKSVVTGAGGVTLAATATTIYSSGVAARSYRVEGQMYVAASVAAQTLSMEFDVPGGAGMFDVTITRAAAFINASIVPPNALTAIGAAGNLTAGQTFIVKFSGTFTSNAAGTFSVKGAATNAGDLNVNQFSSVDIMPV